MAEKGEREEREKACSIRPFSSRPFSRLHPSLRKKGKRERRNHGIRKKKERANLIVFHVYIAL